ncbi:MAG: phosphatase PAP2 family protein [Chitinophagaceae bacterium]
MFFLESTLWQKLLELDRELFVLINSKWTNPVFDSLAPFLRNSLHWIPLYLFILVFVSLNFKVRGLWWIVFFLVTIGLADMTGTYGFKYGIERIRPCNNPELADRLRLLVTCPSGFGFTSNHAANHFGMATFIFITFRHLFAKNWMLLAFVWAGCICYAQIYVGVHYPSDVIAGALLGFIYGIFTASLFNKFFGLPLSLSKKT